MNNVVTTNTNTNVVVVTSPGPAGIQGAQGIQGPTGTISGNTGVNSTGSSVFSGSVNIIGTLSVTGSTLLSGTALLNGAPILTAATLATDRIATTGVTASVSTGNTVFTVSSASIDLFKVTNTGTSGSFIGAFSGSGANLSNIPASGIVGLNLSQIASTTATASISAASGFQVNTNTGITGSLIVTAGVSGSFSGSFQGIATGQSYTTGSLTGSFAGIASGSFSGSFQGIHTGQSYTTGSLTGSFIGVASGSFSGSFQGDGAGLTNVPASGIVGLNLSQVATGSVTASVAPSGILFTVSSGSNNFFTVSGSRITIGSGSLTVSQSINAYNINAGTPTSNNWQSGLGGSYFNNFTQNTDVSEILRFVAGLLSASAPDASPNTKTYANISENFSNNGTTSPAAGYVPQTSTNSDIVYLTSKSFTATGSTLYPGKTVYYQSTYGITYSSTAGGSTIVSSSADSELFGLGILTSGGPTQFNVSGTINWFYSDNNSETSTATSQSQNLLSNSSFGTTNGLSLAKINTANPAVIPAAYQDGTFAAIFSSGLFNGARSLTSVSSSGWYHISASIRISSGSSPYSTAQSAVERIFWAPLSSITIANNTKAVGYSGFQALTASSRSLSGAPYLTAATWQVSSSVTGLFNPMFASSATIARQVITGNASISNPSIGAFQTSVTTGQINTANTVFDSTGVTVRATSTVPFETDLIRLTGSLAMSIGTGTNIAQSSITPTTFTVNTFGTDRSGTEGSTLNTLTIPYHSASTFAQPLTSGSLAYYGQAQGYDGGTLTGGSEAFTGESFRVQITNKFLSGSYSAADAWSTAYGVYNLGALDLQVKPGFLVRPGGTYKYWLNDPDGTKTYKFYARAFQRSSGTAATALTLNLGTTLVAWESATSGVAVAILFKSSGILNYATPRIYDPTQLTSNLISGSMANDNQKNPFTTNVALYGNTGGGLASTTYTVPLRGADGMALDGTNQDYIILIRYTGDQVPVTNITVAYS